MIARLAMILAASVALAAPHVAHAGCPGGGGGGGGGGASGGGGGGGGTVIDFAFPLNAYVVPPATTDEPMCHDTTDVVGYRKCQPYGAWSASPSTPPIFVEGGVIVRQFKSRLDGQTGHVTHGADTFAFRASSVQHATLDRALDTAVLSTIRVGASLPHGVFAAVEADFGGLSSSGATRTEMDAVATAGPGVPDLKSSGGIIIDSLATVGIRGTSSFGSLGVELAGGLRTIQYSFDSHYLSCDTVTTILALAPVAEARVRGELWLGPWMSAGVEVGTSVLEQHAWMGGVYLGVHTRAFSGGL